ncbi:glutathione peroxidase [Rugamonas brunnea]|uniref:glutathione peroxidase n=1 Tax=Rugamonas brunnea TaxID=2758569 RepID=UPI001E6399EF|nr:glutathione peroxidase [Rugamonas brunnea]
MSTMTVKLYLLSALASALLGAAPAHAAAAAPAAPVAAAGAGNCPAILRQTFNRLQDEAPQDLCQYAGKVVLVVNTASYCGFTYQYEGLEAMYAKYAPKGLVVLGFPSNDFGKQEPGNSKQIADFCYNTYGVKFPMFAKSVVHGEHPNPLYVNLIRLTGTAPAWNFHKYLIDRKGRVVGSFPSKVNPADQELVTAVEQALAQ